MVIIPSIRPWFLLSLLFPSFWVGIIVVELWPNTLWLLVFFSVFSSSYWAFFSQFTWPLIPYISKSENPPFLKFFALSVRLFFNVKQGRTFLNWIVFYMLFARDCLKIAMDSLFASFLTPIRCIEVVILVWVPEIRTVNTCRVTTRPSC